MQKLHLVGFTTDHEGLILSARRGARSGSYLLNIDGALEAAVDERRARREEEPEADQVTTTRRSRVESALPVREIQARLRQGRSIAEVARAAGVDVDWVDRFAPPVLAERAQVITKVRSVPLRRARLGPSVLPIGEAVRHHLADRGVSLTPDEFSAAWTARQVAEGRWAVRFTYHHRGQDQVLRFDLDESTGEVSTSDRASGQLGYVAPATSPPTATSAERQRASKAEPEPRPIAKRAVVSTGFRPDPTTKAVSRSAKERERAAVAMRKAAAKRAIEGERAAARMLRERREAAARREREEQAAAARAERAALAAQRAAEATARAKQAGAKKAAAAKAAAAKAKATERGAGVAASARRTAAKRATGTKPPAKKTRAASAPKASAGTTPARRAAANQATARTPPVKQASARKASVKKASVRKASVRKASVKNAPEKNAPTPPTARKAAARATNGQPSPARPSAPQVTPRNTAAPRPSPRPAAMPSVVERARGTEASRRTPNPTPRAAQTVGVRAVSAPARPAPAVRLPSSDGARLTGAAENVYGTESARAMFRRGLVEQVSGDVPGTTAPRPHTDPPPNGAGLATQRPGPDRPRRTRPLRAT